MKNILGIGNALVDVVTLIDDESYSQEIRSPKRKHAAG